MSYVSRLRSGRTYGATSQGSSESRVRVPSASIQHPLLLPPVLDTLFSYMTIDELKNCRLVCSIWNAIGIPLIARKKLHPVEFSSFNYEDFLALKSEFLKFPTKVKFFQGFRLKWEEINAMVRTNFIASFKPRALLISGRIITDPWTNLGNLLPHVYTTLTHLDLEVSCDCCHICPAFIVLLNNLSDLEPLTLRQLAIKISEPKFGNFEPTLLYDLKQALEKLFQSQSKTLEELELAFVWYASPPGNFQVETLQIQLPILPYLRSLDLDLLIMEEEDFGDYCRVLAPFDFNIKFPRLVQMKLRDYLLEEMKGDAFTLTKGHPLKKLEIIGHHGLYYSDILPALYASFPYLEEFLAPKESGIRLSDGGIEIPWVDTLRILDVFGYYQDIDFRHLKKLEYLHYLVYHIYADMGLPTSTLIELLTDHFHQLPKLKSFHLTYDEYDRSMTQEKMDEIREGIPAEFRDIFTIEQIEYFYK